MEIYVRFWPTLHITNIQQLRRHLIKSVIRKALDTLNIGCLGVLPSIGCATRDDRYSFKPVK
jgi:hypothetical protein